MSLPEQIDPEILKDFITESSELVEGLDRDLVSLEHEPENLDLLNQIFRSVHTIKGSSSFLGLAPLTEFAHGAEDALNALRKGQVKVTTHVMDLLLAASDILREQVARVESGEMPQPGPADLIQILRQVGAGEMDEAPATPNASATKAEGGNAVQNEMMKLPDSKKDLLSFMVDDLLDSLNQIEELIDQVEHTEELIRIAANISEITGGLVRSTDFFEINTLCMEVRALDKFAMALPQLDPGARHQARCRALALVSVLRDRGCAIRQMKLLSLSTDKLIERLSLTLVGQALEVEATLAQSAGAHDALVADGVLKGAEQKSPATQLANIESTALEHGEERAPATEQKKGQAADQTIRVDVARLESLLNLIGELVLQKNRIMALSRRIANVVSDHEVQESFTLVASDLDRVTSELQMGVMKTRMQPLSKIFNRYPRVIRDLAQMAGKQIDLWIVGGETEVDKSVIELLGDPLVHIMRNSVDHGIEPPEERVALGKQPHGGITLSAGYVGNHVLVQITDDGRGLDPKKIGQKAVERGLVTTEELALMPETNILKLIFVPGFSTAEKVSDLSGRGVGMDVVKTNISRLNGTVDVSSRVGEGTTVSLKIPLTVAIMQAMMVEVNDEMFAVPLANIIEIVKPEKVQISTIHGKSIMRLRDMVLPLVDLADLFKMNKGETEAPYAVVVGLGEERAGMMVHRLVGQEEVVIKPLDKMFDQSNLVSGATVREDGCVSLILDVAALFKAVT